jgi:hypothetical protein
MRRLPVIALTLFTLFLPALRVAASSPTQVQELATIEAKTQKIRQLKQLKPVRAEFPNNAAFNAALNNEMTIDTPESDVQVGQAEDVLLGIIGPHDDLHKILFQNISAQVAGFYDFHHKILYVRNSGNAFSGAWRWAIAHEYTHALQDEHFNLAKLMPSDVGVAYRNSDAVAAHHALTEGDAVTTQNLFIDKTYSAADIRSLVNAQEHLPKTPPVPKAIELGFNFPYTTGVAFVHKLYASGGMAAITAAYSRLPTSTYEIMYPNAYFSHWHPVDVPLHTVTGFTDWQRADDDVLGAFGYYTLLWQHLGTKIANQVTQSYRGDRYVYLTKATQGVMLFKSVWTTAKAAQLAESELIDALRVRFHHHLHISGGPTAETVVEASGAVYFAAVGPKLTMAYAPTAAVAVQLGTAAAS